MYPARFPENGHSRHPGSGGYGSSRARPAPSPWPGWGATPASVATDGFHHPSHPQSEWNRNPAPDGYGRLPATQATTWGQGLDSEWTYQSNKHTPMFNQRTHWSNFNDDVSRLYPPGESWVPSIDQHHKRLKWRDEILQGDPEKAINDSLPDATRIVITFIARGPPELPHGQGTEILRFRSPRRPNHFSTANENQIGWAHFVLDVCPLFKLKDQVDVPSAAEISTRPFAYMLPNLDVKNDLKLVRKSKPLLWDNQTILESFLYRLVESKEDPDSEAAKDLAQRLGGPAFHGWSQISEVLGMKPNPESDMASTAFTAVCFPPPLSLAIDSILADQESRPEQLVSRALDAFYLCVQCKYARMSFKSYPIPPPPPDQPEHFLCDKRRIWAYWTEVLAWHLSQLREDSQVSISYALLKSLSAVRDSVDDPSVTTLDQLDYNMTMALAMEADRSRNATATLIQEVVGECLHNPSFAPPDKSAGKMHIITAGISSTAFHVISKLITHVLSRKTSPAESSLQSRKIIDLKVTVAESRPLTDGVVMAARLAGVIESYVEYRDRGSKQAKRTSAVPSSADLGNLHADSHIQGRLIKAISQKDQLNSPSRNLQPLTLGLSRLLDDLDAKKEKKEPKVTIEVVTDAAVVSTIMASGSSGIKPIVFLSADRILPNGDSVNKVGSAQMAWAAHSSGGVVLNLCRADRIHSRDLPIPSKSSNPSDELVTGWKSTFEDKVLQELQASSYVEISNPTYEDVERKYITGHITELGLMPDNMLTEFTGMRSDLEKIVWPVNPLIK